MKKLSKKNYPTIVKKLLPFFIKAGKKSIELSGKKLKTFTKSDQTPVSNGDLAVDKMSVGHANENEIYILYFVLFENY